ncbi:MAG: apolipoprotein N-acyltransferase, partial [Alphaproteobacteria bacterium]
FLVSLFFINKKNKLAILILIIIPTFLFSLKFFLSNDKQKQTNENIIVRVVQPNISQKEKWDRLSFENNLEKLIKLSIKDNKEDIEKIVVWPEVALTFFLNEEKELVEYISERIPNNITIITGALRREFTGLNFKIYNSMFVIKDGVSSYYDKKKLVPFGEFVPFRGFLNLFKLTPGSSDFSEGIKDNRMYITINEKKISIEPSICYEAIFQTFGNNNSNFMINATNDAWFGKTTGPRQHLAAQVIRSVEKSVYFLRSSNSGISVIADNNGEILKKIELKKEGFLELKLPLHSHVTIFEKYGSTSFLIFLIILFLLFCLIEILISLKRKEYFK